MKPETHWQETSPVSGTPLQEAPFWQGLFTAQGSKSGTSDSQRNPVNLGGQTQELVSGEQVPPFEQGKESQPKGVEHVGPEIGEINGY